MSEMPNRKSWKGQIIIDSAKNNADRWFNPEHIIISQMKWLHKKMKESLPNYPLQSNQHKLKYMHIAKAIMEIERNYPEVLK